MTDKDTLLRRFKGDYLYVRPKSLPRELLQKIFSKLLLKLFPKKFLPYKDKIRSIMNKIRNYLFFISKNIYLRLKYPYYFILPTQHIHSLDTLLKFLEILKPKKIDFFLLYGSLLGAVRQESFAGRPKDIDLGIKEDQLPKLLESIPLLIRSGARFIRKRFLVKIGIINTGERPSGKRLEKIQILYPGMMLLDIGIYLKPLSDGEINVGDIIK